MKLFRIFGLLLLTGVSIKGFSQEVKNIRVNQSGNRIIVFYDLTGSVRATKLDLYYTDDDGKTWFGPLKQVSGDINNVHSPSENRKIIWDAQAEKGAIEGNLQFRIDAEFTKKKETQPKMADTKIPKTKEVKPVITDADFRKHKTSKNVWLTSALLTGGAGVLAMTKSNSLYDDYQTAEDDATDIHKKVETLDIIYPVAFGVAAVSTVNFIIQAGKQGKAKKQLSLHPIYLKDGAGAALTFKF